MVKGTCAVDINIHKIFQKSAIWYLVCWIRAFDHSWFGLRWHIWICNHCHSWTAPWNSICKCSVNNCRWQQEIIPFQKKEWWNVEHLTEDWCPLNKEPPSNELLFYRIQPKADNKQMQVITKAAVSHLERQGTQLLQCQLANSRSFPQPHSCHRKSGGPPCHQHIVFCCTFCH
jgi:hypothetical protein